MKRIGLVLLIGAAVGWVGMALDRASAQAPARDNAAIAALTGAYNSSGQQLFRQFAGKPGNIVFSPYSIGTAMAMALSGARGDTAAEMSRVLQHRLPVAGIEAANGEAMAILNGYDHSADPWTCPRSMTAKGHQCKTPPIGGARPCNVTMRLEGDRCVGNATPPRFAKLLTANALMLSKRGDAVSDAYTTLLRARYAADIFNGAGLADINAWVARKTEGKIDKILDALSDDTAAILLNAVYFKARWAVAFNPSLTKNDVFNLSGAQKVQVPMMRRGDNLALVARDGYRAIRLPYEISQLGLVALPNDIDGVRDVAGRLDDAEIANLLQALRAPTARKRVDLALPRFGTRYDADLVPAFQLAGMKTAFDSKSADFGGMIGKPVSQVRLYIGQIKHRAMIEIAEESTEAAAATAVAVAVAAAVAAPEPPPEPFHVDRPFLFYLVDDATGAILFQGRVADTR
jgi:serpin B